MRFVTARTSVAMFGLIVAVRAFLVLRQGTGRAVLLMTGLIPTDGTVMDRERW